jgi:hypothetical protein
MAAVREMEHSAFDSHAARLHLCFRREGAKAILLQGKKHPKIAGCFIPKAGRGELRNEQNALSLFQISREIRTEL